MTEPRSIALTDDWPEPTPEVGEVVVEMSALGLCGSDLAVWSGARQVALPWVLGHEGIGRIVSVGSDVETSRIGERVVIEPNYPCGVCDACRRGQTSLCPNRVSIGMNSPGLLRDRSTVPSPFAWRAPDHLSDKDLVCVEPVAVALNAVRQSAVATGTDCLVVGAGSQGLLTCQILRSLGAEVSVIEPQESRLELAVALGASAVRAGERTAARVFETSGTAPGVREAVRAVEPGGIVTLVGLPHSDVPLSVSSIVRRQVHLVGSIIYDHPAGFREALEFIDEHKLSPSRVISDTFEFEDAGEALSNAQAAPGKSWVKF